MVILVRDCTLESMNNTDEVSFSAAEVEHVTF